jgi:hypothetical protein
MKIINFYLLSISSAVLVRETPLHLQKKLAQIRSRGFNDWRQAGQNDTAQEE